jgi:hypothetical protein
VYELRVQCGKGRLLIDLDADGPQTLERLHGEAKNNPKSIKVTFTKAGEDDIRLSPLRKGAVLGHLENSDGRLVWRFADWQPATGMPPAGLSCQVKVGYTAHGNL